MATVKSSAENLTLNADGSGNDILFQSNGSQVGSLTAEGVFTATSFAGSGAALTGLSSFDPDGAVTINESGADVDFRVEGSGEANALFVQGSDGNVGIGTGSPAKLLHLSEAADGTKLRFTRGGISEWDFSIGNTSTLTSVAGGSLELIPLNANTDFAIGKAGTTTTLMHVKGAGTGTDIEGDVTLKTGDIVFGTAGKGICLGVTSNTDANTLDDYEEGTWTAGFSGASVSGGNTTGYYIRVGRICHYQYYSGAMTFSSISGTGTVTGLPFTTSNLGYAAGTYVHGDAWGDSDGIHLGLNATNIYCVIAGATSYRDFVAGSKYLMITGTYIIKEGS